MKHLNEFMKEWLRNAFIFIGLSILMIFVGAGYLMALIYLELKKKVNP